MKIVLHSIRLSIKIPEFNLKKEYKEYYDKFKFYIVRNIIADNYKSFSPEFTSISDNEIMIEFSMYKYPKYDIVGSFFFFDIKKKDIINEIEKYKNEKN